MSCPTCEQTQRLVTLLVHAMSEAHPELRRHKWFADALASLTGEAEAPSWAAWHKSTAKR